MSFARPPRGDRSEARCPTHRSEQNAERRRVALCNLIDGFGSVAREPPHCFDESCASERERLIGSVTLGQDRITRHRQPAPDTLPQHNGLVIEQGLHIAVIALITDMDRADQMDNRAVTIDRGVSPRDRLKHHSPRLLDHAEPLQIICLAQACTG
jgi:hypothetical protein